MSYNRVNFDDWIQATFKKEPNSVQLEMLKMAWNGAMDSASRVCLHEKHYRYLVSKWSEAISEEIKAMKAV